MLTSTKLHQAKKLCVLPRLLTTHKIKTKPFCQLTEQQQDPLFSNKALSLACTNDFQSLKSNAIELDISQEMALLSDNHAIEVSVPVLGVLDLCIDSPWCKKAPAFASILSINGLIQERPDYILVRDIAGNQYEILVEDNGDITLPEEGTGLFTLISHITFIYSHRQLIKGEQTGRNKIILLPIPETKSAFTMHLSVSHINHQNRRIIDTIREIDIEYQDQHISHDQKIVNIMPVGDVYPELYQVEMGILLLAPFLVNKQLNATIRLESGVEPKDNLFLHGWQISPENPCLYTKKFGLSVKTLNKLVQRLYPSHDLVKDYLLGDTFGLSQVNGYNNFLLNVDVFDQFYDRIIYDLINQKLSGKFLFARIRTSRLDIEKLLAEPLDEHDKAVLNVLLSDIKNHRLTSLKKLFLSDNKKEPAIADFFHVNWAGSTASLPQATLLVTQDNHSMHEIVETLQSGGDHTMSPLNIFEEEDFSTENRDDSLPSTYKLEEIVGPFEGFDVKTRSRKNPWAPFRPKPEEPSNKPRKNRP